MSSPYYAVDQYATQTVVNPKNQLDADYNNYMSVMRSSVQQQKLETQERLIRMTKKEPFTEVTRQLKILNAFPPANREKEEFHVTRRKASWLDEVSRPRTSVPGDRIIEPNEPEDIRHAKEMKNFGSNIQEIVNGRAAGTSRNKNGDVVDGAQVYGAARVAGMLNPVLGRPEYKVFHQEDIVAQATAGSRNLMTSASWRGQTDKIPTRSQGLEYDTTQGQNRTRNAPDGNKIIPSFYLTGDGLQLPIANGSGNAIKKPISNDSIFSSKRGQPLQLKDFPPNAAIKEQGVDRDNIKYTFRSPTDNIADRLSVRNMVSDLQHPPEVLGYDIPYALRNDDHRQELPSQTVDRSKVGSAIIGDFAQKNDVTTPLVNRRDNLASALPQAPLLPGFAFVPESGMQSVLYPTIHQLNTKTTQGADRAETPERARVERDIVNMHDQEQGMAAKQQGFYGGREMMATDVYTQQTHDFDAKNAMSLGAHSQHTAHSTASDSVPAALTKVRDAPSAAREAVRVQGKHSYQGSKLPTKTAEEKDSVKNKQLQSLGIMNRGAGRNIAVPMGRAAIEVIKKEVVDLDTARPARGSKTITLQQLLMMQNAQ